MTFGTTQALRVKVAVTDLALFMVTGQVPVPLHAPDQPVNVEPESGFAVNETAAPELNACEQVAGHVIPPGLLTTVPEREPARDTLNVTAPNP